MDVFDTPDLLIDKHLKIKCSNCKKNVAFKDVFENINNSINNFKVKCKNCSKNVNFDDIFNYKEVKIKTFDIICKPCTKNINFTDVFLKENNLNMSVRQVKCCKNKVSFDDLINY
jgi:endogenous inhibitor of DNA gyrase (YacG/DUF329 family)